ncbi:nodulation protein NolU [Mesorhizobium jarvisii]|nr:nodulation protein NolU [Mesorhizobium jarvisii]
MPILTAQLDRSFQLSAFGGIEPAASAHPSRLAARLDPALAPATLEQLQKSPRLQPRLTELLFDVASKHSDWGPDLLRGNDPQRAAFLAGSVWHARSLLKLVSRSDLTALIGYIGADAHKFGIRHLAHSVANRLIADPEKLAHQIEHDGHACLGAWLNNNSVMERNRVLLRLPVGTAAENPKPEHRNVSGQLFSLVMAYFEAEKPLI